MVGSLIFQAVSFELVDQSLMAEAQHSGGAAPVAFGLGHGFADHLNFECGDAILEQLLVAALAFSRTFSDLQTLLTEVVREIFYFDFFPCREYQRAFYFVLQFAYVSGPIVCRENLESVLRKALNVTPH